MTQTQTPPSKMKQEKIFACEKCGIPLTKKLLGEIAGHIFCYYCFKIHAKKLNQEGGKNETENFEN